MGVSPTMVRVPISIVRVHEAKLSLVMFRHFPILDVIQLLVKVHALDSLMDGVYLGHKETLNLFD